MKTKILSVILSLAIVFAGAVGMGNMSTDDCYSTSEAVCLNNVGVTKCWMGTCGHKSESYSYPSYSKSTYTNYYYTGFYLDPGVTHSISYSKTVGVSVSVGGEVDAKVAKASLGVSSESSSTFSVSQSITNNTNSRKYAHMGIEFERRTNTVTKTKRTYNPTWHITAVDKYCTFSTTKAAQSATVPTGCGLSLRSSR